MADQQDKRGTAYVLKAVDFDGTPLPGVFEELRAGRARMAWSYHDNLDLRLIKAKWEGGSELDEDESAAWRRCRRFLTDVEIGDYLIYPNQPVRRQFSVVRVEGGYEYLPVDEALVFYEDSHRDCRSCRPCSLLTPDAISYDDVIVPPRLRAQLGIMGAFFRPGDQEPLFGFLQDLPAAGHQHDGSNETSLRRIYGRLRETLPGLLHREFPAADLSRRFCSELLERMDSDYQLQEGRGEDGSDIVVAVSHPFLPENVGIRIGVQVFSWADEVHESDFRGKLEQLLCGWERNSLTYGALLTTGQCSDKAKALLGQHNRNNPDRLVRLIEGDDLADLFLRHFPPGGGR